MQPQYAMAPPISDPSKVVWTAWVGVNNKDHLESLRLGKCTKPHVVLRVSPSKAHIEKIIATAEKFLPANKSKMPIEPIETDVVYQDDNICILKPTSTRGIVVRTRIDPDMYEQICSEGLKSAKQLLAEGFPPQRQAFLWDNVFFRAPYHEVDCDSLHTLTDAETITNLDHAQATQAYGELSQDDRSHIYIRIDPALSNVYSSEIVTQIGQKQWPYKRNIPKKSGPFFPEYFKQWVIEEREKSEKPCTDYMKSLTENEHELEELRAKMKQSGKRIYSDWVPAWHLLTGELTALEKTNTTQQLRPYYCTHPISRNSEILAPSYVDPDWFVRFNCVEY